MRVALVGSEAVPFVKVGGLGDVLGSLPHHLLELDIEAQVYLPWYAGIDAEPCGTISFLFDHVWEEAKIGRIRKDGVDYFFIGLADFARDQPYGYWDDERRFTRFSLAAASAIDADVVHANDWQTALLPILRAVGRLRAPTLYTIHNIAYQGRWNADAFFGWTELPRTLFHMDGIEYFGDVNLMKGGIVYADRVSTVSPSHAREITTPAFGFGLDGVLRGRADLTGITNGIDTDYWNPETDPHLGTNFSAAHPEGRMECERALAEELRLEGPILGIVSRLVPQKGIDLVLDALPDLIRLGFSLGVVGSGDVALEQRLEAAVRAHPRRVAFVHGYNEPVAHRIYAGARAILIPSRYEPCGLTQIIAQRYGAIPVARAVGGLRDTILDSRSGFLFETEHSEGLIAALSRLKHSDGLGAMIRRVMSIDLSWHTPAQEYARIYRELFRPGG